MKRTITLAALVLSTAFSFAQETVKRSGLISGIVTEKFSVLKADKKTRQGQYTASFNGNVIASGSYTNGKRAGSWNFYAGKNKLVQTFNYDQNKFSFLDSADVKDLKYLVETTNPADVVTVPIKIGGSKAISTIALARTELQSAIRGDMPGALRVTFAHTIVVNESGVIVDHVVSARGDNNMEKTYHLSDAAFDPELTRFIPATVNQKPVMSKVIVSVTSVATGAITRTY